MHAKKNGTRNIGIIIMRPFSITSLRKLRIVHRKEIETRAHETVKNERTTCSTSMLLCIIYIVRVY